MKRSLASSCLDSAVPTPGLVTRPGRAGRPGASPLWGLGLALAPLIVASGACGGGGDVIKEPLPDCKAANGDCGQARFRHAVPQRQTVKVGFQHGSARLVEGTPQSPLGLRPAKLEAIAPAYQALGEHVDEINQTIDDLFGDLEEVIAQSPEVQNDDLHQWRLPDPDLSDHEEVLTVTRNGDTYDLTYRVGATGFDPAGATPILTGSVTLDGDDKTNFELVLDYGVATQIDPSLGLTGQMEVSARPFEDGREIWYDFNQFGEVGGELEESITTYWMRGADEGALEYLDSLHDSDATLFARWDADAGRLDYHVQWTFGDLGLIDEISTDCWGGGGAETFYGWALIDDDSGDYYVELDGSEDACEFGPVDGHPDPGDTFDDLPGEGEWDDLEAGAQPFCEDAPEDPECISRCEVLPDAC